MKTIEIAIIATRSISVGIFYSSYAFERFSCNTFIPVDSLSWFEWRSSSLHYMLDTREDFDYWDTGL